MPARWERPHGQTSSAEGVPAELSEHRVVSGLGGKGSEMGSGVHGGKHRGKRWEKGKTLMKTLQDC